MNVDGMVQGIAVSFGRGDVPAARRAKGGEPECHFTAIEAVN